MKFKDMKIGDVFECWGDIDLGIYDYPKECKMMKIDELSASEYECSSERILINKDADHKVIRSSNSDSIVEYRQTRDGWVTIPESKTEEIKPRPGMSAFYCGMYPEMAEVARKHGYALTVHGSLRKDFDLFAVPWIDNPSQPKVFLEDLTKHFALKIAGKPDYQCGRERWTLHFTFGEAWIDIQFMIRHADIIRLEKEIKELRQKIVELTPKQAVYKRDPYEGTRS